MQIYLCSFVLHRKKIEIEPREWIAMKDAHAQQEVSM